MSQRLNLIYNGSVKIQNIERGKAQMHQNVNNQRNEVKYIHSVYITILSPFL